MLVGAVAVAIAAFNFYVTLSNQITDRSYGQLPVLIVGGLSLLILLSVILFVCLKRIGRRANQILLALLMLTLGQFIYLSFIQGGLGNQAVAFFLLVLGLIVCIVFALILMIKGNSKNILIVMFIAALHYGWFSFSGRPASFEQVKQINPKIHTELSEEIRSYLPEFPQNRSNITWPKGEPLKPDSLKGKIQAGGWDEWSEKNLSLAITREMEKENNHLQHLYVKEGDVWQEVSIEGKGNIHNARWIQGVDAKPALIVTKYFSWYPNKKNYLRFWKSLFQLELRPESSLWRYERESRRWVYLFPGSSTSVSPDRKKVAFLRSYSSEHSLHLYDLEKFTVTDIAALVEADPGSGLSFDYQWTKDSQALMIFGGIRHEGQMKSIRWIYSTRDQVLYSAG